MKHLMILLLVVAVVFGVWDLGWKLAGVPPMFPWQLKRLLREQPHKTLLVDVRTSAEYKMFHIPGAVHMPEVLASPHSLPGDGPDKTVVLVCMTGHRSPVAAKLLQSHTKGRVVNLTWGMLGWLATLGRVTH